MLFIRLICSNILWIILIQVNSIWAGGDQDHVHIKVHVPQVYQKHYHHRTVAKHHYHRPKKSPPKPKNEAMTSLEPEIDFPLLDGHTVSKFLKWQEQQSKPLTWYSSSSSGFPMETPKIKKTPHSYEPAADDHFNLFNSKNVNFDFEPDLDLQTKFALNQFEPHMQQSHQQNFPNDFRINIDNEYKGYIPATKQQYMSNYADEDAEPNDAEYAEEDTDSYMENTETMSIPSAMPYQSHSNSMMIGNDDYYDSTSSDSFGNMYPNWRQQQQQGRSNFSSNKRNRLKNHKRPYRDDGSIKMYGESSWTPQLQANQFEEIEWSPNSFGGTPGNQKKIKFSKGRKPIKPEPMKFNTNNNNNFESFVGEEFGPSTLNEFRVRNKRPGRRTKPKRFAPKASGYKF